MKQIKKLQRLPVIAVSFLLGICFPIIALLIISHETDISFSVSLFKTAFDNSLFKIILLAPVILPAVSFLLLYFLIDRMNLTIDERNKQIVLVEKVSNFAEAIGKADFNYAHNFDDTNDKLVTSLIQMRDNIRKASEEEQQRRFIITGVSEVGELLRKYPNLKELGDALSAYFSTKLNCIQCAFYLAYESEEREKQEIELISTYAYSRKKYIKGRFIAGEGLVGQAVIEQDQLYRTEIPSNYVTITSGLLGEQRPRAILITPLITNASVYGVIEMASVHPISELHRNFMLQVGSSIARTIFNVTVNERTLKLLSESQQMSSELREQRTQLLQNAEEMEQARIELEKTNAKLENQIIAVNNIQKQQNALLEHASEIVTIVDKDGIIRYQSPSVRHILGYDAETNINQHHTIHVAEDDVEAVNTIFKDAIELPGTSSFIQFRYLKNNGEEIWIESIFTNLLYDTAIQGIVINSRDITGRRMIEKEQRLRGQMQALSENSHDLILRLGTDKKIYYSNPVIQQMTGLTVKSLINAFYPESDLPDYLIAAFDKILEQIHSVQKNVQTEEHFATVEGDKIYTINGIPERDQNGETATVLIVAHDITARKKIEAEIIHKNKSITESIQYSYRIQNALMPTQQTLRHFFPECFMFYRSKDIVSGDFPYIYQKGDNIFIAAVDCTGHGVPGALMSFVGYFTLNQIMNEPKDYSPGQILDLLHERVQKTLKQDTGDTQAKDGMDIALCKINRKHFQIEFAGAHRPLYHYSGGNVTEFKGDKYPIAGMYYKNRQAFTNHSLKVKPNDSIFMNTDGLPDQFGGSDGKQKFMSKRVKELIGTHAANGIGEMEQLFINEFDTWKGPYKQMDDVLLIGIKF